MSAATRDTRRYADRVIFIVPWLSRWVIAAIVVPIVGLSLAIAFPDLIDAAKFNFHGTSAWSAPLTLAAVLACSAWLLRRERPLPVAAFLALTTVVACSLRVAYSLVIVPEWTNDFLLYWNTALSQVDSGNFIADSFYNERSLPVLVPLVSLFGDTPYAVKLANITMLGLVQLAGYDMLRRLVSHQAAQGFTVVFAAAPIPIFALTIPSHDLWAMFFLAVAAWICTLLLSLGRAPTKIFLGGITLALSAVCVLMDMQRGVGTVLAVALALASLLGWSLAIGRAEGHTQARSLALVCAIALLLQVPLSHLTASLGWRASESPSQKSYMTAYYGTHGTSLGNGTWGWMQEFQSRYTDPLQTDPARLDALARSLILTDWSDQPEKRIQNVLHRLDGLYLLDNSDFWYFTNINPAHERLRAWLMVYSTCFSVVFALCLLASIGRMLLGADPTTPTLACIVFVAMVSLALASFSENQPRYIMWLWFAGPLWIAEMFARRPERSPLSLSRGIGLSAAAFAGWLLLLLALWAAIAMGYGPERGRILADWMDPGTGRAIGDLTVPAPANPYEHATQPGELSVALGRGALPAVEHDLCVDRQTPRGVTFFLRSESPSPGDVLLVSYASVLSRSIPLPQATDKTIEVRLPQALQNPGCHRLRLELRGSPMARAVVDFPRLER